MEAVAVVVPMEVEAEVASTVAVVEAAERIAAVVVVCTAAADRRVTQLAAWAPMVAAAVACTAARVPMECTAAGDRMARMAVRVRTG